MTCMRDRDIQCFEDCKGCPRAQDIDEDDDRLFDEDEYYGHYDDVKGGEKA